MKQKKINRSINQLKINNYNSKLNIKYFKLHAQALEYVPIIGCA